ncbi:hypothetical protein A3709_11970 [Halioglobus sp. HI00S01]|uniref:hypothetical protein n=1 Tax=Halioglobus sp. HI00S01 TaxID=1822214 RepID=UPI0007C340C7|nr:hypothetical protein [Halioglobus sp. HI00S01]KZX60301.1 hypothetical protein A3709_11970 [Halioglobus sp. HI00S01]
MNNPAEFEKRFLEVKEEVSVKCGVDVEFREAFLKDPRGTLEAEYGLEPGALGDTVFKPIVEERGEITIVLPPDTSEMELSDEELDQVAGGFAFSAAVTAAVITASATVATTTVTTVQRTRAGRSW